MAGYDFVSCIEVLICALQRPSLMRVRTIVAQAIIAIENAGKACELCTTRSYIVVRRCGSLHFEVLLHLAASCRPSSTHEHRTVISTCRRVLNTTRSWDSPGEGQEMKDMPRMAQPHPWRSVQDVGTERQYELFLAGMRMILKFDEREWEHCRGEGGFDVAACANAN